MKKFFYGFWVLRNPLEPKIEWNKYYKGVKKATVVKSKSKRNKAMVITAKNRGINMHQYRSLPIK